MNTQLLIAGYRFANFPDYAAWRAPLQRLTKGQLRGTILLAPEGINLSLYGTEHRLRKVLRLLHEDERFDNMMLHHARVMKPPFNKMKIKIKREIISLRYPGLQPHQHRGRYLSPHQWDGFIQKKDVLVVDARNDFENAVGSFPNAINLGLNSFCQFPGYINKRIDQWQRKRIALFCTGGIRCEKLSCYLERKGLTNVYQLHGGIIKYLQEIPTTQSSWEGDCFVFDERISIKEST